MHTTQHIVCAHRKHMACTSPPGAYIFPHHPPGHTYSRIISPRGSQDAKDGAIDAGVRALNRQRNVEASTKTRLLRVIGDPKAVSNAPLPGANRAMLRQVGGYIRAELLHRCLLLLVHTVRMYNSHTCAHTIPPTFPHTHCPTHFPPHTLPTPTPISSNRPSLIAKTKNRTNVCV